jgi:hypothetical protein
MGNHSPVNNDNRALVVFLHPAGLCSHLRPPHHTYRMRQWKFIVRPLFGCQSPAGSDLYRRTYRQGRTRRRFCTQPPNSTGQMSVCISQRPHKRLGYIVFSPCGFCFPSCRTQSSSNPGSDALGGVRIMVSI